MITKLELAEQFAAQNVILPETVEVQQLPYMGPKETEITANSGDGAEYHQRAKLTSMERVVLGASVIKKHPKF